MIKSVIKNICEGFRQKLASPKGFVAYWTVCMVVKNLFSRPRSLSNTLIGDERLPEEHRDFLSNLRFDDRGLPLYNGAVAGIGGCYSFNKINS